MVYNFLRISAFVVILFRKIMQTNNPLHGKTLQSILEELVKHFGWEELAQTININCFKSNPSINSSLKFLRKTEWARKKVEQLYVDAIC
jgi:uncharacterized protein (DUF2132 family)